MCTRLPIMQPIKLQTSYEIFLHRNIGIAHRIILRHMVQQASQWSVHSVQWLVPQARTEGFDLHTDVHSYNNVKIHMYLTGSEHVQTLNSTNRLKLDYAPVLLADFFAFQAYVHICCFLFRCSPQQSFTGPAFVWRAFSSEQQVLLKTLLIQLSMYQHWWMRLQLLLGRSCSCTQPLLGLLLEALTSSSQQPLILLILPKGSYHTLSSYMYLVLLPWLMQALGPCNDPSSSLSYAPTEPSACCLHSCTYGTG